MKNCPNCSAPLEPYKCKCDYCGTYYYDLTALDVSGNKPTYVKFKVKDHWTGKEQIITALAYPVLDYIEQHDDYDTVYDRMGTPHRIFNRQRGTVSMKFELIGDGNKLYQVEEG